MQRVPPPWVLKPRSMAGSMGIKKIQQLPTNSGRRWRNWATSNRFTCSSSTSPATSYHVDSIFSERKLLFSIASRYGRPPMDVSQQGDIFTTRTLPLGSDEAQPLIDMNERTMKAFGLLRGVSHSEFIRGRDDGKLYFLETSARVGGAHIVDLIEAATGINLWAEWAKVEIAGGKRLTSRPCRATMLPDCSSRSPRQEHPDTSAYNDPEIVWRMNEKKHHVGLIVKSPDAARVEQLVAELCRSHAPATSWPGSRPSTAPTSDRANCFGESGCPTHSRFSNEWDLDCRQRVLSGGLPSPQGTAYLSPAFQRWVHVTMKVSPARDDICRVPRFAL